MAMRIAAADDGHSLHVALGGAASLVKVDTVTRAAGTPYRVGLIDNDTVPVVMDLDVAPGAQDTIVAVAQAMGLQYPQGSTGPLLFRDGARVFPATVGIDWTSSSAATNRVEFIDANTVFSHGDELSKISIAGNAIWGADHAAAATGPLWHCDSSKGTWRRLRRRRCRVP